MNPHRVLSSTYLAALAVNTVGAIDPLGGGAQMPSPKAFLATVTVWSVLGLVAGFGASAARASAQLAVLLLLTMVVVGPFGKKVVAFGQELATRTGATS